MIDVVITGSPYSCDAEKTYLNTQKEVIDYHTKNFGIPSKSTVTSAQLKKMQDDYNVAKEKFDKSDCNKDPDRDKCLSYQAQIGSLRSTITYSIASRNFDHAETLKKRLEELMKKYKDLNCDAKISEFRGGVVMSIADIYQQMDKERIEAENKYQVKQRLFFGAIVVFGALLMVTTLGKKN
jgi:hypothetical protein